MLGPKTVSKDWNVSWRLHLVRNLEVIVLQLWKVGIESIYIDGSFAEMKDHPNDIDGYFECDFMDFVTGLCRKD